jgi:Transposase DDE domain/Insertion element 4 transposase N-terminal
VSESATPSSVAGDVPGVLAGEVDPRQAALRDAVIAGPGGGVGLDPALLGGALRTVADPRHIAAGLAAAGYRDRRKRVLTAPVVVAVILGLCLFRRENYDLVIGRVLADVPRVRVEGRPSGPALSKARTRLDEQVMVAVFSHAAAAMPAPGPECYAFGLLVTAFDGTVLDLAATGDIRAAYATPAGGRFPQVRMVALVVCGLRWVLAARIGCCSISEQALADHLADQVRPGTLNLADRGWFSMHRWMRCATGGGQLAWRVKNGHKSLPARIVTILPDGSALVRLHESDAMLSRRRAKLGQPHAARLPDTLARLVECTLLVRDRTRHTRTSRFRILTTLLDHETYPAGQIAAIYAERWQIELTYARIKTTLRGTGTRLRGHTPELAIQEVWGLLIVYNALVALAVAAAVNLGVDPDEISFTTVLALTQTSATTQPPCPRCGHRNVEDPIRGLVAAIATQPRNRIERHRTSPRTARQRQTEHTRDVTYEINIETPNLPREHQTA